MTTEPLPTCPACGEPIQVRGGVAILCGPGGGTLALPAPTYCHRRECRAARDAAAMERAIAAGVILP